MKYLLFFLLAFTSVTLTAQKTTTSTKTSSSTSVSETATNDAYSFILTVDRKQVDDLVSAYMKIAKITGIEKIVGISIHTTNEGAVMEVNTKKQTLRISSDEARPESISVARGLADRVRVELSLAPAPPH